MVVSWPFGVTAILFCALRTLRIRVFAKQFHAQIERGGILFSGLFLFWPHFPRETADVCSCQLSAISGQPGAIAGRGAYWLGRFPTSQRNAPFQIICDPEWTGIDGMDRIDAAPSRHDGP